MMRWFSRKPRLEPEQQRRMEALKLPAALDAHPLQAQRLVVLDLETTGFDLKRDLVISIGAVVIERNAIPFDQMFERTLYRDLSAVTESVLIHGIAPSQLAAGDDPVETLLEFMEFVGDSPLLAYHARFDQQMLARALKDSLGYKLRHPFFDIAEIGPLLRPEAGLTKAGLDDWVNHFKLQVHQRHHASADALVTAELGLILFNHARQQAIENLAQLEMRLSGWRHRQQLPLSF
jgi:DNA polymerase III subunit epsilon